MNVAVSFRVGGAGTGTRNAFEGTAGATAFICPILIEFTKHLGFLLVTISISDFKGWESLCRRLSKTKIWNKYECGDKTFCSMRIFSLACFILFTNYTAQYFIKKC